MAFKNFIYNEDDDDLAFLPKEPLLGFGIGSPSISMNTEPLKADEDPVIPPAEATKDSGGSPKAELFVIHLENVATRIKDRRCKTRGIIKAPVKRKLASGSSISCSTLAKPSTRKMILLSCPYLMMMMVSLPDAFELKDPSACHLKIFAITPIA
ncbi:hypothetical protein Tco_1504018 [Tanacetum coccineum]